MIITKYLQFMQKLIVSGKSGTLGIVVNPVEEELELITEKKSKMKNLEEFVKVNRIWKKYVIPMSVQVNRRKESNSCLQTLLYNQMIFL